MRADTFKTLRMLSSFALVGTVLAGTMFGGANANPSAHLAGAGVGLAAGFAVKFLHLV